jgi:protein arginine N-methyltransferase 5
MVVIYPHNHTDLLLAVPLTNSHNTRSALLTFSIPHAGALTGLAGYFECHLYGDVGLSIHPERMHRISPDMQSWFPLFFPFKDPLYLPSGSELDVHIWRLTDPRTRKVWYEWHAEAFLPLPASAMVQPPNGTARVASGTSYMSAPGGQPSPMMDAQYSPNTQPRSSSIGMAAEGGRLKIGQTALHNPGGRSSWIGL